MITAAEIRKASIPFKYKMDMEVQETRICKDCGKMYNYNPSSRSLACSVCRRKRKSPAVLERERRLKRWKDAGRVR